MFFIEKIFQRKKINELEAKNRALAEALAIALAPAPTVSEAEKELIAEKRYRNMTLQYRVQCENEDYGPSSDPMAQQARIMKDLHAEERTWICSRCTYGPAPRRVL